MKQKCIFLYLHPTNSITVSWVVIDETNNISQSVSHGDLSQFPADTHDYDTFVFVPTENVLLTHAQLPKLSRQRLLQALPFALEEQLIDDVTQLHFAIGEYQADGNLPVVVVSQVKMNEWLNLFAEINLSPRAILPSLFMVSYAEDSWHINTDEAHCIVRTEKYNGFACEKENLDVLLELKSAEQLEKSTTNFIRTEHSEQKLLEKIALDPTNLISINLLQGAYQAKPQGTQIKKIWKFASYLAIAAITVSLLGNVISLFILQHQASKIDTAINAIYKKNFPNAKSIVAPRERMTEKLRTVSGQAGKSYLLALLGEVGKGLSESKAVHIQNLDFRDQQLTLAVTTKAFEDLDKFTRVLTQQGLNVKQQNAAASGSEVKATIIIKQGGAA